MYEAKTVQQLIEQLTAIQDKSQFVAFNYWLADDFESDTGERATQPAFESAIINAEKYDGVWEDADFMLAQQVHSAMGWV